ncbi:hypothetical protein R3P38DRAFT_2361879, partial [Favolaschia claudopus]
PPHHNTDAALSDLAVTPREKELLNDVRKRLMDITMETCDSCNEKWFDLAVNAAGLCRKYSGADPRKYTIDNMMDPGSVRLNLPVLTQMEEILISPVHALTQVWQIHG